jgi:hypothetical protein
MRRAMMVSGAPVIVGGVSGFNTLTIDHTKCGSSDATDFPLAVFGTLTLMKSIANGGSLNSVNNVAFYADAGHTTLLKFERVFHSLTTGAFEYHVKIPTLSHTADTVIHPFIDTANSTDLSDPTNVWDAFYKGVWHLKDGTTLSGTDATTNANNTTLFGPPAAGTGQIDGGAVFTGGEALTLNSNSSIQVTNSFSLQGWVKVTNFSDWRTLIAKSNGVTFDYGFDIDKTNGKPRMFFSQSSGGVFNQVQSASAISTATWYHLAATYDGTTMRLFRNGVADGTTAVTGNVDSTGNQMAIGKLGQASGNFMLGTIDEVRLSKGIARSVDWFLAEYNNQSSPSTFYTLT